VPDFCKSKQIDFYGVYIGQGHGQGQGLLLCKRRNLHSVQNFIVVILILNTPILYIKMIQVKSDKGKQMLGFLNSGSQLLESMYRYKANELNWLYFESNEKIDRAANYPPMSAPGSNLTAFSQFQAIEAFRHSANTFCTEKDASLTDSQNRELASRLRKKEVILIQQIANHRKLNSGVKAWMQKEFDLSEENTSVSTKNSLENCLSLFAYVFIPC